MLEVVLDTNVLVSAFRSSLGASYQLLQTLERGTWRPVISPALAFEYEAVLKRGATGSNPTLQDVDEFVEYLCSRSRLVQIYFRWRPTLPDPDDDRILEVAVRTSRAAEVAAEEHVSVEELFAAAFEERVLEFERLKDRAAKGSYEKFRQVMSKVPPAEPAEYDRL